MPQRKVKKIISLWRCAIAIALASFAGLYAAVQPSAAASTSVSLAPARNTIDATDGELASFFDNYMTERLNELSIPGAAMIVVRDGRQIFAKGYGLADVASKRPVSLDQSLFRAASSSKILTWLLVMQLVEERRLDLDADVNRYLNFEIPQTFGRPITMRHLMTHSAGFPEHFHGLFDRDQSVALGQRLRDNIPEQVYEPGTTIAYSNYGAALAGYIVERLRGESFERVARERIFKPVQMRSATLAQPPAPAIRQHLVSNYEYGSDRPDEFRKTLVPIGALSSPASDMGRLLAMLANGGQAPGGSVVAPDTMRQMMTLTKPLVPGLPDGMGLGFIVGEHRGVRYAGHAGNMGSSLSADLEILPDHGLAYYFVVNSQGYQSDARKMRDDLLVKTIARFAAPDARPVRARGPSSAQDVAGWYLTSRRIHSGPLAFSGLLATTPVTALSDGSLAITAGSTTSEWLPDGRDRFVHKETGIPLLAQRGESGRVERIASAALYPVAVFDRAPLLSDMLPFLGAFAFGTIFLALLVRPFAWAYRRRRSKRAPASLDAVASDPPPTVAQVRQWARISFWMIILSLGVWAAFGIVVATDSSLLFSMPAAVRILLGLLTMLSAVFAAVIGWDAVLSWSDPQRGMGTRLAGTVLAAAMILLSALFYILDVTNISRQW